GRMCLGSRGGLRKADGRERGGLGLRRRQQVDRALRGRWYRYHRPRRVGADHVRPGRHLVRKAAEGVLRRGARSHAAESPGPRRRDAVSLVDLLLGAGTAGSRRGLHPAVECREGLQVVDRDEGPAARGVLSGRGLAPAFAPPASRSPIQTPQRSAEGGTAEERVPGAAAAVDRRRRYFFTSSTLSAAGLALRIPAVVRRASAIPWFVTSSAFTTLARAWAVVRLSACAWISRFRDGSLCRTPAITAHSSSSSCLIAPLPESAT